MFLPTIPWESFIQMAAVISVPSASVQAGALSLSDALRIADENAISLRISNAQIEKARQQANAAKGQLGPKVSLDGTYTRFDKAQTTNFGGTSITTRPIDNKDAKLNFSMPLDLSGVTGKAIKAAGLSIRVAELNRATTLNTLHQQVKKSYYDVLQSEGVVKVAEEGVARAQERLNNVRAELAAGSRARVDVIRLETAKVQADADLITANNFLSLAKSAFNNVLGRAIDTPFELADQPLKRTVAQSASDLFAVAKENRPELQALRTQQELTKYLRLAEERGGVPSLNVSAVHDRTFGQGGFGSSASSTTGVVAISIPLFDSGITRSRVRAARQDEEQVKLQLEQSTLGVSLDVQQAYSTLLNADAREKVAEQQVKLAEETYRLTSLKFDAGEGIPLEVADASTQLTQAKTQLVTARYDYLRAIADLERAIGKDLMVEGVR